MIRLATLAYLSLATPALSQGWELWLSSEEMDTRIDGMIVACILTTVDPGWGVGAFKAAGWQRADEYDGNASFQSGDDYAMFSLEPGFCMLETPRVGTNTLAAILIDRFEAVSLGTDAAGCATFSMVSGPEPSGKTITVTLTGGGNDPACTSDTEAALRFEVTE